MKAVRAMKTSEQQMLTMTGAASPLRRVTFTAVIISLQLQACACGLLGTALAALSAGQLTERPLVDGSLAHPLEGVQTVTVPVGGGAIFETRLVEAGTYPFVSHAFADATKGAVGMFKAH